jgi:hypothetical protein
LQEKKTEKLIMVNIEKPVILITDSESEDANKLKKKKYEDEYRVIADLTGFDNLKGMMEAEAFRRRKTRKKKKKKKKKNGNALCYAQEEVSVRGSLAVFHFLFSILCIGLFASYER